MEPHDTPHDTPQRAGRPRGSSREMLQEAAAELFLEHTYARTTIEQIARRAGVSRNTFFNYFTVKSDLLWVEVDSSLAGLAEALERAATSSQEATDAVRAALLEVACDFGPARVPWALTQYELMGTTGELEASALSRFAQKAGVIAAFVLSRGGADDELAARSFAMAVLAAAAAAAMAWARAGVTRGNLAPYVDAAISPVCLGYRGRLVSG